MPVKESRWSACEGAPKILDLSLKGIDPFKILLAACEDDPLSDSSASVLWRVHCISPIGDRSGVRLFAAAVRQLTPPHPHTSLLAAVLPLSTV